MISPKSKLNKECLKGVNKGLKDNVLTFPVKEVNKVIESLEATIATDFFTDDEGNLISGDEVHWAKTTACCQLEELIPNRFKKIVA